MKIRTKLGFEENSHINPRDEIPSKAFCFIIEYTPYVVFEIILNYVPL